MRLFILLINSQDFSKYTWLENILTYKEHWTVKIYTWNIYAQSKLYTQILNDIKLPRVFKRGSEGRAFQPFLPEKWRFFIAVFDLLLSLSYFLVTSCSFSWYHRCYAQFKNISMGTILYRSLLPVWISHFGGVVSNSYF